MRRQLAVFAIATVVTSSASAQTKFMGAIDCDKADPMYVIPIPERQGFALAIGQYKCTWPKGVAIAGAQATDYVNTSFSEVAGSSVRSTSMAVTTFDSGDKAFTRSTGKVDVKTGTISGKWTYIGGTGKLAGIKGGGTYLCKLKGAQPGVGYGCDIRGSYILAPK